MPGKVVRVLVEPQRALDGAASVARVRLQHGATVAACERQVTADQQKTGFIHTETGATVTTSPGSE